VKRKTEGECEPWPGQPGQSDVSRGRRSLHYRLKEHVDSRRRWIFGTMPEIIDGPIEGAVNNRKDEMRERSAQKTKGLGRATAVSLYGENASQRQDSARRTTIYFVSRHSGGR